MDGIIETAKIAALRAGSLIVENGPKEITAKGLNDFVTEIDLKCQEVIISTIKENYPAHNFLAEESDSSFISLDNMWIIDPLDGTTNYIHGLNHSGVSIAYYDHGEIKAAVIYNPFTEEMFHTVKGEGAYLNNLKISVSSCSKLKSALVATGFPFRKHEKISLYKECFAEMLMNCSGIRRMGAASLDLAYVACGRYDTFFEGWLSPWDIAAGVLLVKEAGGVVTDFSNSNNYLQNGCIIAAADELLRKETDTIVNKYFKDENYV